MYEGLVKIAADGLSLQERLIRGGISEVFKPAKKIGGLLLQKLDAATKQRPEDVWDKNGDMDEKLFEVPELPPEPRFIISIPLDDGTELPLTRDNTDVILIEDEPKNSYVVVFHEGNVWPFFLGAQIRDDFPDTEFEVITKPTIGKSDDQLYVIWAKANFDHEATQVLVPEHAAS